MRNSVANHRLGPLTIDEYLALEQGSSRRHEFVAGRIYAMAGTTARHNRIVSNIHARLRSACTRTHCSAYVIDLKVRVGADRVYYPDALVVCEPHDGDATIFEDPCLVVEVTSPSTRRLDRGEKLTAYLSMPSLQAYLIADHDGRHITSYTRGTDGAWTRDEFVGAGTIALPCPVTTLTVDDIYHDVELPARVREPDLGEETGLPDEWADDDY